MKRAFILVLAALALVLAACTNSFTSTAMDSAKTTAQTSAYAAANAMQNTANINVTSSSLTYGQTDQKFIIQFSGINLSATADQTALASAVVLNKLSATATTDGAYNVTGALSLGTPEVSYVGGNTYAVYTLNLSGDTAISDTLEVVIAGDKLTGSGGSKILDLDGDEVIGEAGDDDYVGTVNVSGAPVAAGGVIPNPRTPLSGGVSSGYTIGSTTVTFTALTTVTGAIATIDSSLVTAAVSLVKLNKTANTWDTIGTSSSYNAATGVLTMTLPTAVTGGDVYRVIWNSPTNVIETAAVRGYKHRWDTNNKKTTVIASTTPVAPTNESTATFTATTNFDSNSLNGYVTLSFNNVGTQGFDTTTLTTTNVKLYNSIKKVFVNVSSIKVLNNGNTAIVALILPPTYMQLGDSYKVAIGPGVKALGNTTASTDDTVLGDYTNFTNLPYGFKIVTGGSSI